MPDTDWNKEIRDKLYERYDKEINNLWQRFGVHWGFQALFLTGFGYLVMKYVDTESGKLLCISCLLKGEKVDSKTVFLLLCGLLAFFGQLLAILWVMTSKASHAIQTCNENLIEIFESSVCCRSSSNMPDTFTLWSKAKFCDDTDQKLFSLKSGAYSVAKINIAIALMCFVFWSIASVVCFMSSCEWPLSILDLVVVMAFFLIVRDKCKSNWLGEAKPDTETVAMVIRMIRDAECYCNQSLNTSHEDFERYYKSYIHPLLLLYHPFFPLGEDFEDNEFVSLRRTYLQRMLDGKGYYTGASSDVSKILGKYKDNLREYLS